jgi:hypothetical protein
VGAAVLGELAAPGSVGAVVSHPLGAGLVVAALVLEGLALVAVVRLSDLGEAAP